MATKELNTELPDVKNADAKNKNGKSPNGDYNADRSITASRTGSRRTS